MSRKLIKTGTYSMMHLVVAYSVHEALWGKVEAPAKDDRASSGGTAAMAA